MATSTPKTLDTEITRLSGEYGISESLARKIIDCEGKIYGNVDNKNYRNGVHWSTDVGPWQINDFYHKARMDSLGLNIYDKYDNLEFGFMLLREQGTKPWSASKHCWNPKGES